jgi:hypothetical protein
MKLLPALGCAACFVALASPAFAQSRRQATPPLGETLKGDAKAAYEEARRLFKAGDYKASLDALERAQKLSPDPRLFWNMAACENKLGHHAKAITLVEKYLAAGGGILSDAERKEATDFIVAMQTLVGTVTVSSPLEGVELAIDDEIVGATPFARPLYVDAGEHRIRMRHAGYKEATRTETVPAGGTAAWTLEMTKDVHEGRIVVTAGSGESIWLDGELVGTTQWGSNVASGKHTVLVTATGKKSREQAVDIHDGDVKTIDVHLQESSGSNTWIYVSGGALLAAGAVVGGYFLFKGSATPQPDPKGTLGTFSFP